MNMKMRLNKINLPIALLLILLSYSCNGNKDEGEHKGGHGTAPDEIAVETMIQTAAPNNQVLSRQGTIKLNSGQKSGIIKFQGYIVPAISRNKSVAARFGGRVEKLYVTYNNQFVQKGEKVMDIYSPELSTFQEEHLFILKSNAASLLEKSRQKLLLVGMTASQISGLEKRHKVESKITIYSPATGYIVFSEQSEQINSTNSDAGMSTMGAQNSTSEKPSTSSDSQIREGAYINKGQTLFNVNDLLEVWALISVPSQYLTNVTVNQPIEIISETNTSEVITGKIDVIEQTYEETNQRFGRLRIVLPNTDKSLKINSLVNAKLTLSKSDNLQVPTSAVYKTGLNAYVWVKIDTTANGSGIFQARKVNVGANTAGMTIINGGLAPNEEIAKEAGLMTDSESFLKVK